MLLATRRGYVPVNEAARPESTYRQWSAIATDSFTGRSVTPESALAIAAAYGGVSLIANMLSIIPCRIQDKKKKNTFVERGILHDMLRYQPNRDTTAAQFFSLIGTHLLLRGNFYAAKFRPKGESYPTELIQFAPDTVFPYRDKDGRKLFRVRTWNGQSYIDQVYTPEHIWHVCGPSFNDGLTGETPFGVMRNRIGVQLAASEYQARFYQNGAAMKGVIEYPGVFAGPQGDDAIRRLRDSFHASNAGLENAHRTAVLEGGATFKNISITPQDQELIETLKWGATEIATALNIPASWLNADSGKGMRYANVAQDALNLKIAALQPRTTLIEQSLNADADLFGVQSPWVPKFDYSEFLRADEATRWQTHKTAFEIGAKSPNDIRMEENMSPREGGDQYNGGNSNG